MIHFDSFSDSGMGLLEVNMATGFSASVDDVTRVSGDLALIEQTSDGLAVYWNEVSDGETNK